jgi:hypothetical protein
MGLGPNVKNSLIQPSRVPYPSAPHPSMLPLRMQTRLKKIGTDIDNMETRTTDDRGHIAARYEVFMEVFNKV